MVGGLTTYYSSSTKDILYKGFVRTLTQSSKAKTNAYLQELQKVVQGQTQAELMTVLVRRQGPNCEKLLGLLQWSSSNAMYLYCQPD